MSDTQREFPSASQGVPADQPGSPTDAQSRASGDPYAAPPYRPQPGQTRNRSGWAGWVLFAGILMILIGAFQVIAGLVALFRDTYYLVTSSGLLVSVDYTTWGWVHLILGLVIAAAGLAVMRGALWGRIIGIVLACLSALANLAFLAASPVWSLLVIAMDVLVIFALAVHGSEVRHDT